MTELTDKEKCLVVQMMLRQSPRLAKVPIKVKESIQLFYKQTVYPDLTPQDISKINLDLTAFLEIAEGTMQKALIESIGGKAFTSIMKKFGIGKKDSEIKVDDQTIKQMETMMKKEVDEK